VLECLCSGTPVTRSLRTPVISSCFGVESARMATASKMVSVFVLVAVGVLVAQGQNAKFADEQAVFREDEPFQRTVPLPPNVLQVLLQTKEIKEALASENGQQKDNPAHLFRAGEVHLSASDDVDLVVVGTSPLSGADNSWFWVVSSARLAPRVVLWASGNYLKVMGSRTNGYRNIRSFWASASTTKTSEYHFNGKEYTLWKESWGKNRY